MSASIPLSLPERGLVWLHNWSATQKLIQLLCDFSGEEGLDGETDHAGQDNGGRDFNTDEPVLNAR